MDLNFVNKPSQQKKDNKKTEKPFTTEYTPQTEGDRGRKKTEQPFTTEYTPQTEGDRGRKKTEQPFTTEYTPQTEGDRGHKKIEQPFTTEYTLQTEEDKDSEKEDGSVTPINKNGEECEGKLSTGTGFSISHVEEHGSYNLKNWGEGQVGRCDREGKNDSEDNKNFAVERPKEKPIQYISDLAVQLAEKICRESCPDFTPFIADAIYKYQQENGKIEDLFSVAENIPKKSPLNFDLELERIVEYVTDTEEGEEFKRLYNISIEILQRNGRRKRFKAQVESENVKDIKWVIKATDSLASLPKDKSQRENFQYKVQQCIETENVPHEIIYPNPGWREVPGIGWRYVYGDGIVGGQTGWIHTPPKHYRLALDQSELGTEKTFKYAMGMADICKNKVASLELFLFVHATMVATLFEKAGHRINFLFGICGVTNSRKTSMTLAIAKVFGRNDSSEFKADAQFAIATRCGIETTLGTYKDAPVIIDDFKPGSNTQEQREMDRKLDELARFYGDGIAKKRMNNFLRDNERKYFPIYGGCVLTMELVTGVLSSVSRMFITEIDAKEVDNECLRFYQENLWILPTHLYDFLAWITERFDTVIACISEKYKEYREVYRFEVARYAEMFALFKVTALLISRYAVERAFWDGAEGNTFLIQVEKMMVRELNMLGNRLKRHDKTTLLLKILDEMMQNTDVVFTRLTPESCAKGESCYEDEQFYYIQAKRLMQVAKEYCARYSERDHIISDNEVINLLEKLELLDIWEKQDGRERSRKLPTPRGNTKRYLYIKKQKLKEHLGQLE